MKISKLEFLKKFRGYINLKEVSGYFGLKESELNYKLRSDALGFWCFHPNACDFCLNQDNCTKDDIWDRETFKLFKFKKDNSEKYPTWMRICIKYQKK